MDVGSCIYTGVREIEMKKEYGIPEGLTIAAVVGFGYPKKKIKSLKNRRRLSEVAFSERFGEKLRLI
jgi:nitroreductase